MELLNKYRQNFPMKASFLSLLSFLLVYCNAFGQNISEKEKSDDASRIVISTFISDKVGNLTDEAKNLLAVKINEITSKNGMGGAANSSRFIITPALTELSKDITTTEPVIYQYELQVTLFIGDGIEGTKFSSLSIIVSGNGPSETKAYISALKKLKASDPRFKGFIDEAKEKIISYYQTQCDFIIKDAQALAGQNNFDEAMYKLCEVPTVCKECYDKCMDKVSEVFKAKLNRECQQYLANAKVLKTQNKFDEAALYLSPILPDMSCYADAQALLQEINDHRCAVSLGKAKGAWASKNIEETSTSLSEITADSKCAPDAEKLAVEVRAYLKEQEKYAKDKEMREFKFELQKQKDATAIQKATIKAARDVGVAYGRNQPKTVYKVVGWGIY